jgi:subtilase family serine protease
VPTRKPLLAVALLLAAFSVAGCTGGAAKPAATTTPGAAATTSALPGCLMSPSSCYPPYLFEVAYGIQPLLARGINGRGETVTVLASPLPPNGPPPGAAQSATAPPGLGDTDIRQDLAAFDRQFRLTAPPLQVVSSLAGPASPYQAGVDEVQDVEMVHAFAPAAAIRVVLLPSNVLNSPAKAVADLLAGLRLAVSGTDVTLVSWSLGEHFFTKAQAAQLHSILLGAQARHVTVVAASGDNGGFSDTTFGGTPVAEVSLPASDPLVLAVGGTTVALSPSGGGYAGETPWNGQAGFSISGGASGGGFSHLYARPSYQDGVPRTSAMRGVPDVAADADQASGVATETAIGNGTAITPSEGTGAAAALWAAVMALADQYAHHDLGFVNPAIYRVGQGPSYHMAFHDVSTGSDLVSMPYPGGSAGYQAGPGWDPATGWGTPDAQVLIPALAA